MVRGQYAILTSGLALDMGDMSGASIPSKLMVLGQSLGSVNFRGPRSALRVREDASELAETTPAEPVGELSRSSGSPLSAASSSVVTSSDPKLIVGGATLASTSCSLRSELEVHMRSLELSPVLVLEDSSCEGSPARGALRLTTREAMAWVGWCTQHSCPANK